eukprot:Gregarina_sp_Pseudo_9__318@NODE_1206_length_1779_cov_47_167241_g1132_i0_p2_GENE_NODE_1206_length_1779_cov_47_167241_g1132_i0NODE_1206_length_1779_cov_47_167241_g1132_i0_p2_ORF_typecomplete_len254_score17_25_NODE_1206_length_1779_cov_47_167241_g1132_i09431704
MLCTRFIVIPSVIALAHAQILSTPPVSTFDVKHTKCYRLRADKQVRIYGQGEDGSLSTEASVPTIPGAVAANPLLRMEFQAAHGFDDVDNDGVERFRFTIICRCHNETNVQMHHMQKAHLAEVDCQGQLKGGRISYNLGTDKIGQCFVASQRQTRAAPGNLSRFFLKVGPEVTLDRSQATIDPEEAYFPAGKFKLHRYTYRDVCNQDFIFSEASAVSLKERAAIKELPLADEGPQYARVAYEGDHVANTIALA